MDCSLLVKVVRGAIVGHDSQLRLSNKGYKALRIVWIHLGKDMCTKVKRVCATKRYCQVSLKSLATNLVGRIDICTFLQMERYLGISKLCYITVTNHQAIIELRLIYSKVILVNVNWSNGDTRVSGNDVMYSRRPVWFFPASLNVDICKLSNVVACSSFKSWRSMLVIFAPNFFVSYVI